MRLSKEEADDIIDGPDCVWDDEWPHKYGYYRQFGFIRDGQRYMFEVYGDYTNGLDIPSWGVEAYKAKETTVTKWVRA